jgi:hypothetical protein
MSRLNRANSPKLAIAMFAVALLVVFFWPRGWFVTRFVIGFASIGFGAGGLFALTYWREARIRIGRLKLRYMAVRRIAALATIAGLAPLLVRAVAVALNSAAERQRADSAASAPKLIVAIAHFRGDSDHRVEDAFEQELRKLRRSAPITVRKIDQVVAPEQASAGTGFVCA